MACEQEDALASLQKETEAKAAMITDMTAELQQLNVSMDDQAHGFRTEAALLQATNSTQGRQVCQFSGCAFEGVAPHINLDSQCILHALLASNILLHACTKGRAALCRLKSSTLRSSTPLLT